MSEIREGDLVVVVRPPPCGCVQRIGFTFTVRRILQAKAFLRCVLCGDRHPGLVMVATLPDTNGVVIPLSRLKKIEPLNEGDEAHTEVPAKQETLRIVKRKETVSK